MGATDLAMVYATGKTWFMVPEAIKMEVSGELNPYTAPKDIILKIIGEVGIAGATYKTAEFCGETIEKWEWKAEPQYVIWLLKWELKRNNGTK